MDTWPKEQEGLGDVFPCIRLCGIVARLHRTTAHFSGNAIWTWTGRGGVMKKVKQNICGEVGGMMSGLRV